MARRLPFPAALPGLVLVLLLCPGLPGAPGRDPLPEAGRDLFDAYDERIGTLLEDAGAAAAAGDHARAVPLLQEAADLATGQVVRVGRRTYLGVREYVNARLRSWPPEGLAAYRRLTDPRARAALDTALRSGDARGIDLVARRYALSSAGAPARLALGTRALSRGDHDTALRHLLEILRLYPAGDIPGVRRADVLARAALAAAGLGDRALLAEVAGQAAADAAVPVTLGGAERPLSEVLDLARRIAPPAAAATWPTLGGSAARSGGGSGPAGPLDLYYVFDLPGTLPGEPGPAQDSPRLPFHPVVSGGLVVTATHLAVLALPLPEAGRRPAAAPEPRWVFPGGEDLDKIVFSEGLPPMFATLSGDVVVLPFRDHDVGIMFETPTSDELVRKTLLALSLPREGALLDQRGGADPLAAALVEDFTFCGAPAAVGDRVYVTGTRFTGLTETFVFCFERAGEGEILRPAWRTFVARGQGRRVGEYEYADAEASPVAVRHGVVYVCTNAGAVAALDAESGETLWTHAYEEARERYDVFRREVVSGRTWFANAPVLDDRFLCVAPMDSEQLLVFFHLPDPATGFVEHGAFSLDDVALGFDPRYLLGLRDGVAFLAGSCRSRGEPPLFAVRAGSEPGRPPETRRVRWRAPIEEDAPCGRGAIGGDFAYFPTAKALYRVSLADGRADRLVDFTDDALLARSGGRTLAGNVAVAGPWLVTAGEDFVAVFGPPFDRKDPPEKGD